MMPWLVTIMQLNEIPFRPVLPFWYTSLNATWLICSIFLLTMELIQTLYQAIPIFLILLIGLPLRVLLLHNDLSFDLKAASVYVGLFALLGILACTKITIDWVGGRQNDHTLKIKANRQASKFKQLLN